QNPPRISEADRPFLGMAANHYPFPYPAGPVPNYGPPAGYGPRAENHTLVRANQANAGPEAPRLFQVPFLTGGFTATERPQPPIIANQMLSKTYNNLTTRSNVFAVWVTVGYFEVLEDKDPNTGEPVRPVKLGAEIGKAENRQVRHRFFAVVDRSALTIPSPIGALQASIAPGDQLVPLTQITNINIQIGPESPIEKIDPMLGRST